MRKCRECGSGIIVRPRFLIFGTRPELIPDALWQRMEAHFADAVPGTPTNIKPYPCSECRKGFKTTTARDNHLRDAHAIQPRDP